MLQVFYLDIAMTMLQMYILNVSSVSNVCCNLFHLSVAKVYVDIGLLSEKERASAEAMVAAMWGGGAGRAAPVWKRRGSHPSSMEEVGTKRCGREAGEVPVWKKQGQVIRAAWATEQKGAVQTRAREAEVVHESERPGRSRCGASGRAQPSGRSDASLSVVQLFGLVWFTLLNYLSLFNLHLDKICLFCFSTFKLNFDFKFFEGISSTTICV
jgi:hypothetical protein